MPPYAAAAQGADTPSNDFRARFHRPLTAPSPFRTAANSVPGSGNRIDPNLGRTAANGANGANGAHAAEDDEDGSGSEEDADMDLGDDKDEEEVTNDVDGN